MNYFNYFTEIETFYQARRESFTLLSSLDWVLIENWKEQGVPLEIVLKGIDRAFSNARRKVNSLAYCVHAVAEALDEEKGARIEKPQIPEIPAAEARRYLADLADKTAALTGAFPEFAARIAAIAESVRAVDIGNFRDAEQALTALEEKLVSIMKVAADDKDLLEIQRSLDAEMSPFRSTMTADQLAMVERQLWKRKLMEKYNAPRLSLFYLI